ncbi:uncharacterized protein [Lepisosteus oculatus]|uniref:uncharacterized protein isoform X2 n=1 Tax=Lepisosteus oculatus TaxID=7918 RepID=UPI003717337E
MEMRPIYTGDLVPSLQGYSRIGSQDGEEGDKRTSLEKDESLKNQSQLQQDKWNLSDTNKKLWSQNKELSDSSIKLSSVNRNLSDFNSQLQNTTKNLSDYNKILQSQIKNVSALNVELESENRNLTDSMKHLMEQNANLSVSNRDLKNGNSYLSDTISDLGSKIMEKEYLIDLLQSQNSNLSDIIAELKNDNHKLVKALDKAKSENQTLLHHQGELEKQLYDLTEENTRIKVEMLELKMSNFELSAKYSALHEHCHSTHGHHSSSRHRHHGHHDLTGRAFYFPTASDPLYVRLIPERHEALTETTVCLRYSSDQNKNMFLFSISTPHEDNVLTLYKVHQGEYAMSLNNEQTTFKVNDTAPPSGWTHICVTWESATGSVRLFVNGMHSRYQKGSLQEISHGMQSIYLGQDPASSSGKKGSHYSFSGQITEVYVGDTVLSDCEISALNAGLDAPFDSLLSWKSLQYEKHDKILLKHVKGICL